MDPITARRVLRIFPEAPLSSELIVQAHAGEVAARHPSLYPEGPDRARAEEWVRTLDAARDVLLSRLPAGAVPTVAPVEPTVAHVEPAFAAAVAASGPTTAAPVPAASNDLAAAVNAPRRRGLSRRAVVGIVAGGVGLVVILGLMVLGVIGIVQGAGEFSETLASELAADPLTDDGSAGGGSGDPGADTQLADVERYTAAEMFFTFPAAMELYNDGRYSADCPIDYVEGCWQSAIITESDCDALQVELGFANDPDAFMPEHVDTLDLSSVAAGATTPVVFGQDEYDIGWINDVRCLDAAG